MFITICLSWSHHVGQEKLSHSTGKRVGNMRYFGAMVHASGMRQMCKIYLLVGNMYQTGLK